MQGDEPPRRAITWRSRFVARADFGPEPGAQPPLYLIPSVGFTVSAQHLPALPSGPRLRIRPPRGSEPSTTARESRQPTDERLSIHPSTPPGPRDAPASSGRDASRPAYRVGGADLARLLICSSRLELPRRRTPRPAARRPRRWAARRLRQPQASLRPRPYQLLPLRPQRAGRSRRRRSHLCPRPQPCLRSPARPRRSQLLSRQPPPRVLPPLRPLRLPPLRRLP